MAADGPNKLSDSGRRIVVSVADLDTWEEIASACGVSVKEARGWAKHIAEKGCPLAADLTLPLGDCTCGAMPVTRMREEGRVKARSSALQAWADHRFGGKVPKAPEGAGTMG